MLAGAGHAQLDLLAALSRGRLSGCAVTLITSQPAFHYSGMLPAVIAGVVDPDAAQIPVADIARAAGIRVLETSVVALDVGAQQLTPSDGSRVGYDLLSLDVGSSTAGLSLPGVDAHAFAMRPFSAALGLITKLDAAISATAPRAIIPSVVVGGGAAGFEIACAVRARILAASRAPRVTIIDASARDGLPLAGFADATRRLAARALSSRGIAVVAGSVTAVHTDAVTLTDASVTRDIASAATAWVPGPAAHPWLATSGLRCDDRGYPLASPTLALDAGNTVFGGGDCVTLRDATATPKAGVFAVRMAPVLAANVLAVARGESPAATYAPQRNFLALLSTGDGRALLRWRGVSLESRSAQRLKTWIDERYLTRYRVLAR